MINPFNQSLWLDEATSALTTKMSLADFFGKFMPGDFHPPLYYLVLHVWSLVFGSSEFFLRSLSILFFIGTIYLIYKIGGKLSAIFLATGPLLIYYAFEVRMYMMSAFLVALAVYFFTKILHKGRVGEWLIFSLVLGLIGLTDYLPLLILPVFLIYGILSKQKLNWWKTYVTSHIILVIFAIIWFPVFSKQFIAGQNVFNSSSAWINVLGKFSFKEIFLIPVKFMIGRIGIENKGLYGLVIVILATIFGYLILRAKNKLIWLWLSIPLILGIIVSIKIPILSYFRFLFVLPAFYLLISEGIKNLHNKKLQKTFLVLVILINLISSGIYLFNKKFQREDWRALANDLRVEKEVSVVFPTKSQQEAMEYYQVKNRVVDINNLDKNKREVWLVRYAQDISDPMDVTRLKLESLKYSKIGEIEFNGISVWKYK